MHVHKHSDDATIMIAVCFYLFACNPARNLHSGHPNFYQNHPIYAPKRNDEHLAPFSKDSNSTTAQSLFVAFTGN